jgi:hypothetical protein
MRAKHSEFRPRYHAEKRRNFQQR